VRALQRKGLVLVCDCQRRIRVSTALPAVGPDLTTPVIPPILVEHARWVEEAARTLLRSQPIYGDNRHPLPGDVRMLQKAVVLSVVEPALFPVRNYVSAPWGIT
jgi:hypothetical protein